MTSSQTAEEKVSRMLKKKVKQNVDKYLRYHDRRQLECQKSKKCYISFCKENVYPLSIQMTSALGGLILITVAYQFNKLIHHIHSRLKYCHSINGDTSKKVNKKISVYKRVQPIFERCTTHDTRFTLPTNEQSH